MSDKYKVITYSTIFSIGVLIGLLFQIFQSGHSERGVANVREPQSIKQGFDFNDELLSKRLLKMVERDRLINSVDLSRHNHELEVTMSGLTSVNCSEFDTTQIEFVADGMMVNGERPSLVVEAPCLSMPVHIPVLEITKARPADTEMRFLQNGKSVKITVKDSPPQWPENWILRKIVLTNSKNYSLRMEVPAFEVGMGRRDQIVMRW